MFCLCVWDLLVLRCSCPDYCSDVGRVFVTGYDINLSRYDVDGALRKLFSSCGLITDICIRRRDEKLLRFVDNFHVFTAQLSKRYSNELLFSSQACCCLYRGRRRSRKGVETWWKWRGRMEGCCEALSFSERCRPVRKFFEFFFLFDFFF